METKFSVAVDGLRKSVLADRLSISGNRSHLEIDLRVGGSGDSMSLRLDRDSLLQIVRRGYAAGILADPAPDAASLGRSPAGLRIAKLFGNALRLEPTDPAVGR